MNGDQVQDTWFWPPRYNVEGCDTRQVQDLFRRVAAELDAGRPAGPLIETASLPRMRTRGRRCDIEAVGWFLGQFLLPPGQPGRTGSGDDLWRDLPVTQLYSGREGRFGPQCEKAWRDFGQLPGTRLWWGRAGMFRKALWTAEQQVLASIWRSSPETVSAGGRDFIFTSRPRHHERPPRTWDAVGAATTSAMDLYQLVDESEIPILYTADNFIMFPDRRWLRFLVRGTRKANAIMTAVDQAGNRVARYRIPGKGGKDRIVRIDHEAARRVDRSLRVRSRHAQAHRPHLWLGASNRGPLTAGGIYQMVARRGKQCGVDVWPHRFRHHFSHTWLDRGGAEGDLMELNGWSSPQMLRRYGGSARGARARRHYDLIMTG